MKFDKKFDEEIKKETELLSPSEEQLERIINGVYARIEREKNMRGAGSDRQAANKRSGKLPIKFAAVSGTAACAAALAIFIMGANKDRFNSILGEMAPSSAFQVGLDKADNFNGGVTAAGYEPNQREDTALPNGSTVGGNDDGSDENSFYEAPGEGIINQGATSLPADQNAVTASSVSSDSQMVEFGTGTQEIPYLSFSDSGRLCTVTVNGKAYICERSEITAESSFDFESAQNSGEIQTANSDLGQQLFIKFDRKELYIYSGSGEFLGFYTIK